MFKRLLQSVQNLATKCSKVSYKMFKSLLQNVQKLAAKVRKIFDIGGVMLF